MSLYRGTLPPRTATPASLREARPRPSPGSSGGGVRAPPGRSLRERALCRRGEGPPSAAGGREGAAGSAADARQAERGQPAPEDPGAAGSGKFQGGLRTRGPGMRLHCEVEVVSRRLPALGLRSRGRAVRAVLSLCQREPRGGPPRAGLLVATLRDKRGTRYEVRAGGRAVSGPRASASPRGPEAGAPESAPGLSLRAPSRARERRELPAGSVAGGALGRRAGRRGVAARCREAPGEARRLTEGGRPGSDSGEAGVLWGG